MWIYTEEANQEIEKNTINTEHPARTTKIKFQEIEKKDISKATQGKTTIYTDGSKTEKRTGAAYVIYRNNIEESSKMITCNKGASVFQCEMLAIQEAIRKINEEGKIEDVVIISDSKSALEALRHRKRNTVLIEETINEIKKYQGKIEWNWTRAHNGTEGNDRADELAKQATEKNETERTLPIPIRSIKLKQRQETERQQENWWRSTPNEKTTKNFYEKQEDMKKHIEPKQNVRYNKNAIQLVTGHGSIKTYIKERLKKIQNDECECVEGRQDVEHILFKCSREDAARSAAEKKTGQIWPKTWEETREITKEEEWVTALNTFANTAKSLKENETTTDARPSVLNLTRTQ